MPRVGFADMPRPRAFFSKTKPSPDRAAVPTNVASTSAHPPQLSLPASSPSLDTVIHISTVQSSPKPKPKPKPRFSAAIDMEVRPVSGSPAGRPMPATISMEDGDESVYNEPLIHEETARNIPEDFRPRNTNGTGSVKSAGSLDDRYEPTTPIPARQSTMYIEDDMHAPRTPTAQRASASIQQQNGSAKQALPPSRPRQFLASMSSTTQESQVMSSSGSVKSYDTGASSVHTLPALQEKAPYEEEYNLDPITEDDPRNFDLLVPGEGAAGTGYSLETRSEELFSREHLQEIFNDSTLLLRFTTFLSAHRPQSVPLLIYYLDALKALRAINYANAIAESLDALPGHDFSQHPPRSTLNSVLEEKAKSAFDALVRDDLAAFVTHTFIQFVSVSIQRRITGTLPPHLREASEGLAEVFCLTDPSRADNPIVFASEEFHRTTQYGVSYAIGRNCRFLQGPRTNPYSVQRLKKAILSGREVSEVFLNYRRDGSPFMNLLMVAPLLDSRGNIRYFIGAQVDVSGLVRDCSDLEGLQRHLTKKEMAKDRANDETEDGAKAKKDEFQLLSEMLNTSEMDIVRRSGGKMHREHVDEAEDAHQAQHRPRLLLKDPTGDLNKAYTIDRTKISGKLEGIYQNYLLVRPYPSLRILFSSPALRLPGILQSPFMSRIGGSSRVRDELTTALAQGRGVTAKVRWVSGRVGDEEGGRPRWIHCTPLLGHNGAVGVWMIVIVDDDGVAPQRRFRTAPPVANDIGGDRAASQQAASHRQMFEREGGSATSTIPSRSHSVMTSRADEYGGNSVQPMYGGGLSKESFGLG